MYILDSIPDWAKKSLDLHRGHPRLFTFEQLETAQTEDELWNAAQRQLTRLDYSIVHSECFGENEFRMGPLR